MILIDVILQSDHEIRIFIIMNIGNRRLNGFLSVGKIIRRTISSIYDLMGRSGGYNR